MSFVVLVMSVNFKIFNLKSNILPILTCVMAVALQVQLTLFAGEGYAGLRLNLADLFLPTIGVGVLLSLLFKRSSLPRWSVRYVPFVLLGLLAVMSISLLQGYWTNGFLSQWALVNKYIGFVILLSYLALGAWLVSNEKLQDLHLVFVKYFCGFYVLVLVESAFAIVLQALLPSGFSFVDMSWDGLMANRNAFVILTVFVLILLEVYRDNPKIRISLWMVSTLWFLMPFFVVFNASRTGWIVIGSIFLVVLLCKPFVTFKKILPPILLGVLLCFAFLSVTNLNNRNTGLQLTRMIDLVTQEEVRYRGDRKRLIAVEDGLELYNKSNPVTGAGLGAYQEFQIEKRDEFIDLIDCTPLWLLVETGALGLLTFGVFFLLCLWVFYHRGFGEEGSVFHRALFFFLIAFACISVLHEITYTRFLWLVLGMGLVQTRLRPKLHPKRICNHN